MVQSLYLLAAAKLARADIDELGKIARQCLEILEDVFAQDPIRLSESLVDLASMLCLYDKSVTKEAMDKVE
jgi:hypothetical protein